FRRKIRILTKISFDLVHENQFFRFFGTFNRPKTTKPAPQKIATLFFGSYYLLRKTNGTV
ncbi:MAG: hypothetical protein KKB51_12470, partial [Candidatus Riflebacteria bacterium]|nr:hypothetical protein [Candidatus Riflebacteria bacterium]